MGAGNRCRYAPCASNETAANTAVSGHAPAPPTDHAPAATADHMVPLRTAKTVRNSPNRA